MLRIWCKEFLLENNVIILHAKRIIFKLSKMKTTILITLVALQFLSCSNENEVAVTNEKVTAPVRVHVDDFSMSVSEFSEARVMTRSAQNVSDYKDVGAIDLAFYAGTTEVYKKTQLRNDSSTFITFGDFSCNLPMGSYTMVVIGRGVFSDDNFELTSPELAEYTGNHARETFVATQTVTISNTDSVDLSATLNRVISKLKIESTDEKIANATSVRTTFSAGGKKFNPSTGLAAINNGFSNTVKISAADGKTTSTTNFLFLSTDEQTMDVTIETLDKNGNTLFSKTVSNVALKRNRVTTLKGAMYTNTALSGSFLLESDWLTENTISF